MYDVDEIACIYRITNTRTAKAYIGNTKNLRTRLGGHIYALKNGRHYNHELQSDYDIEDVFSVDVLAEIDRSDGRKERNALEAYFVLLYKSLENGYNMVYTYQDEWHTVEAIRQNAEYIINCLRKNGIRFKLQCGIEEVVEIRP